MRSIHFVGLLDAVDGKKSSKLKTKDALDLYFKISFTKNIGGKGGDSDAVSDIKKVQAFNPS